MPWACSVRASKRRGHAGGGALLAQHRGDLRFVALHDRDQQIEQQCRAREASGRLDSAQTRPPGTSRSLRELAGDLSAASSATRAQPALASASATVEPSSAALGATSRP